MKWKKETIVTVMLVLIFCVMGANAQTKPKVKLSGLPMNLDFVKYLKDSESGNVKIMTNDGRGLGGIPQHIDPDYVKGATFKWENPIISFPAKFDDLRQQNKLTPIRDQGNCGSCWTFATFGSIESGLYPDLSWNFSENNMKNLHGFDPSCCDGGNTFISTAYLSRWDGPINESDDPYKDDAQNCISPARLTVRKHLQEVIWFPKKTSDLDNNDIKQAVSTYGAAHTSMCWVEASYNANTYAYYYNGTENQGGHEICIVGWDDNFEKSKFNTSPPGNGAYICRNSWGPVWGENGYFYVSYYDTFFGKRNFLAIYPGVESPNNYDNIYCYDLLGLISNIGDGKNETIWFANIFTASSDETLVAASWFSTFPNSSFELKVYLDPTNGPINQAGAVLTQTGSLTYMGYKTIELNKSIKLTKANKFSLVVKLTTPGLKYPMPVEYPIAQFSSKAAANAGESYVSTDGSTYDDLTSYENYKQANACLRAFTLNSASQRKCGDCNNDGEITAGDAQWAFDCYLGKHTGNDCDKSFADVNSDSDVTPGDAQLIFDNYLKGTQLNCP